MALTASSGKPPTPAVHRQSVGRWSMRVWSLWSSAAAKKRGTDNALEQECLHRSGIVNRESMDNYGSFMAMVHWGPGNGH